MSKPDLAAYIDKYSKNDFIHVKFTWQELGRTKEWYRKQSRGLNGDLAKIKRELDLEWTRTTDASIFSEEEVEVLSNYTLPIIAKAKIRGYFFNLVTQLDRSKKYIVGVDCATGVSRDNTAITIVDYDTGRIVGNFHNNKIDSDELFFLVTDMLLYLMPTAVLAIERNSVGIALIDRLLKTMWAKNLFYTIQDKDGKRRKTRTTTSGNKSSTYIYGINTTSASRPIMIDILQNEVTNHPDIFTLECINKEIATLIRNKRGKIEHAAGCHDDNIFSFLMTKYAMTFNDIMSKLVKSNTSTQTASKSFSSISSFNSLNTTTTVKQISNTTTDKRDEPISGRKKNMLSILALNS